MNHATCQDCGVQFAKTHGRMKYCPEHRGRAAERKRETVSRECANCATIFATRKPQAKLCSDACRSQHYRLEAVGFQQTTCALPVDHPVRKVRRQLVNQKSAHRTAWEARDYPAFHAALRASSMVTESGCWEWPSLKAGYPVVKWSRRTLQVHRMSLEAKYDGRPLGKQAAHHMCANSACVNPEHLQPVTARDNTAEMLARTYLESRIADLEAALALHAPGHELLRQVGVAAA